MNRSELSPRGGDFDDAFILRWTLGEPLGTNPGGSDEGKPPLASTLVRTQQGEDAGNDYLDDPTWGTHASRQLQSTVKALLHLLAPGRERHVCASNIVFMRSRTVADLDARIEGFWQLADACWPAHEVALDVVRPRLIVAYGNGAGGESWPRLKPSIAQIVRRE